MGLTFRQKAFIAVFYSAWPFALALGGILIAAVAGFQLSTDGSDRVRFAGTILQLLGLGTVAIGLSKVRRLFGRPSLIARIAGWFHQLRSVFTPPFPIGATGKAVGRATVVGRGDVILAPGAPLERRLAHLEADLKNLKEVVLKAEETMGAELKSIKGAIAQEMKKRETEISRVGRQIEEVAVGGINLEFVGLTWLLLGVLGTSVPAELARLFSALVSAI